MKIRKERRHYLIGTSSFSKFKLEVRNFLKYQFNVWMLIEFIAIVIALIWWTKLFIEMTTI